MFMFLPEIWLSVPEVILEIFFEYDEKNYNYKLLTLCALAEIMSAIL